jgi:folate-dependent phosphoribosylglycinamide formyltransferase PurN
MPLSKKARTVLICHAEEKLNRIGLARWMASFTDLAAVVVIHEPKGRLAKRIRREIERIGLRRFVDVLAFRVYYRFSLAAADRRWEENLLRLLENRYPALPDSTRILDTPSPNSRETEQLLREAQPDIIVARCKNILAKRIFGQARAATLVMHPGVCPEYRNAHGCFWALANRDTERVGMTLLKVDAGVDTGPVYGYYSCRYDEARESHIVIQNRVVFDNLDALRDKFEQILEGTAEAIDTRGRKSQAWGQPWLTRYWRWKRAARRRRPD